MGAGKRNLRELGTEKEEEAIAFLKAQGYRILCHSYRCRFGEIDVIGEEDGYLCFIEVKYRRDPLASGFPEQAVDLKKQRVISRIAMFYLTYVKKDLSVPCRFDVVALEGEEIRLHRDAFPYRG